MEVGLNRSAHEVEGRFGDGEDLTNNFFPPGGDLEGRPGLSAAVFPAFFLGFENQVMFSQEGGMLAQRGLTNIGHEFAEILKGQLVHSGEDEQNLLAVGFHSGTQIGGS